MGQAIYSVTLDELTEALRLPYGTQVVEVSVEEDRKTVTCVVKHPELRTQGGAASVARARIDGHALCWVQEESEWESLRRSRRS